MSIDWTFNAGQFLVAAGPWAFFGLWFLFRTRGKADTVGKDVGEMKVTFAKMQEEIGKLATAVSAIAVAETKIAAVNARLDDEKREGVEFREWLRKEISRLWDQITSLSTELKGARQDIGTLQGRVSGLNARVGAASDSG